MNRRAAYAIGGAVLGCLLLVPSSRAQTTGEIVGTVQVEGAGPIDGAVVQASGPSLQGLRTGVTGVDGRYVLPVLPPGVYSVTFSAADHASIRLEGVEVQLGKRSVADAILPAGPMAELVSVTADPPLIDTLSVDNTVTVSRKLVDGMPLLTQDYWEFAKLVPSVTATEVNMTSGRGPGVPSFRGEGQYGDNYLVDGLTGRDPGEYTPGTPIPIAAIEEVQLVADGFAPEYGQMLGGMMNIVTRSGSNDFAGSASYVYTSNGLAVTPEPTLFASPVGYHNSSPRFDVGGPMVKDRLWYFASVDGIDAATTFASSDLAGIGTLPQGTEDRSGYTAFAKLTAAITPHHNLALSYTRQDVKTTGLNAANAAPEAQQRQDFLSERLRLNYQALFGASTILELKGGLMRQQGETQSMGSSGPAAWEVVTYGVTLNNAANVGTSYSNRTDLAGVLTQVWNPGGHAGAHQFKAGIEYHTTVAGGDGHFTGSADDVIATGQNPIAPDYGLADTFSGGTRFQVTAQPGAGGTILVPAGLNEYRNTGAAEDSNKEWGLFIQDQWSIGRWSLMAGLRADSQKNANDTGAVFSQFGFAETLAPRIGVTVDVSGKGSSILKGAWGRFYDVNSLAYSAFANSRGPFSLRVYNWTGGPPDQDFRDHVGDGSVYDIHNPANWGFSWEQSTLIPIDYSNVSGPQGADRWLLEYDQLLPRDLAVAIRYVDHSTRGLIDDINTLDPTTMFRFVVQNTNLKQRNYRSAEIELSGRLRPNLTFKASYVHSDSQGTDPGQFEGSGFIGGLGSTNYIGVYLDRPASDPAFWCTFFGPTCLPTDWNTADPHLDLNNDNVVNNVDYDLSIQNLFAGLGSTQTNDGWYGPLAYAVDDLVKFWGRLDVPQWDNFYVSWYAQWGSGYHMSRRSFVRAYGDYLGFDDTQHYEFTGACTGFDDCETTLVTGPSEHGLKRGSLESPNFWTLDLTLGKLWNLPHKVGLEIRADILNVFNQQTVLTIQDRSTETFGEPLSRQAPRSWRLYATVRF